MSLPVAFDPSLLMAVTPSVLRNRDRGADGERVGKAAEDFEAVLLTVMIREMRKSIPHSGLHDEEDHSGEGYREMMDAVLGQYIASSRMVGLAQVICERLAPSHAARAAGYAARAAAPNIKNDCDAIGQAGDL